MNSAFSCWPAAHIYFRYYDKLTPEVREGLKKKLTTDRSFGFVSTGNLFAMTAIPYYLAYEAFGKDAMSAPFATGNYHKLPQDQCNIPACRYWHAKGLDWSSFHDGRGRAIFLPLNGADKFYDYIPGHDPTARNYIENVMIGDVVREGLMEYNCWPYGADNILPYLTLAENTRDKELARKTLITYETILAGTAANWLGGHWAAAQGRSYPNTFNQRPWLGTELFWPYFGGNPEARPGADYFDLMVAASRYRMPEYIAGAAQIRSGEYVSRTNFMKRRQYSFLNRRYAIYSQFDKGFPTDFNPRFGIVPQSKRTGIVWEGVQGATVFWVAHPLYSPKNGKMGTSGYGTSDRERTTQYKGTLVQTYNIPHEAKIFDGKAEYPTCPFTIACVPTNYLAVIDDGGKGRMFFHYKNVMIALTSSASFSWKLPAPPPVADPAAWSIAKSLGISSASRSKPRCRRNTPDPIRAASSRRSAMTFWQNPSRPMTRKRSPCLISTAVAFALIPDTTGSRARSTAESWTARHGRKSPTRGSASRGAATSPSMTARTRICMTMGNGR